MLHTQGEVDNCFRTSLLALGGNLPSAFGFPVATLRHAVDALICPEIELVSISSFYATPCFPKGAGPEYVNAAAEISTTLLPKELLKRLHDIEHDFERHRETRWGSRTLDLDLISYDNCILPDLAGYQHWSSLSGEMQKTAAPNELILPHPRIQDRAFVLVPLVQIAPNWRHPVLGKTASQLLAALPPEDIAEIRELP